MTKQKTINTLIVGAGDAGRLVADDLLQAEDSSINLVGFVDGVVGRFHRCGAGGEVAAGGMAGDGETIRVAAETARIFLGMQIQCANCHDHPTDSWKREQFHGLAAFFPRIQVLPRRDTMMRSFEVVSLKEGESRGPFESSVLIQGKSDCVTVSSGRE